MIVLLLTFLGIALFDFVPLLRHRQKTAIAAFLMLFIPALVISLLLVKNIPVPSVMMMLGDLFKSIGLTY